MAPIRISRDQAVDLIDSNHFSLDEIAFFVADGPLQEIFNNVDLTYFDVSTEVIQKMSSLFENWNTPSILLVQEDSDVCPASITVASCKDSFSVPLYDVGVALSELEQFFSSIPSFGDDGYPHEQSLQDQLWARACINMKCRALGLLSSFLARNSEGEAPEWFYCQVTRIIDEETEDATVVFTGLGADNLYSICYWDDFWNGLEEHEGPARRTTWTTSSRIEVFDRDLHRDLVSFWLVDEDGHESFKCETLIFDQIKQFLLNQGWSFTETSNGSTTSVGANNNYGRVYGDVNINSSNWKSPTVSPTPHVQPTQQRPGAAVESGIISGNVNISGLAQINGIVQGDVTVPSGSDVNLNGIVQGTVWVNGGTARLFGTISGAAISSGRIEIYGILQSPLQYNGGDVYFHPNSIIG